MSENRIIEIHFTEPSALQSTTIQVTPGVTYIVGRNGAGKSMLLNSIEENNIKAVSLARKKALPTLSCRWGEKPFDQESTDPKQIAELNTLLGELRQSQVCEHTEESTTDEVVKPGKVKRVKTTIVSQRLNNEPFAPTMLSDGTTETWEKFRWNPVETFNEMLRAAENPNDPRIYREIIPSDARPSEKARLCRFILWDEPEVHLHPDLQRELPKRIDEWREKHSQLTDDYSPTFILIATHSPFVLAGAAQRDGHHVVCLEDRRVIENSLNPENNEYVTKAQVRHTANLLLGTGLDAYFPDAMVLAERSVGLLLRLLAEKFRFDVRELLVDVSGDSEMKRRVERFSKLLLLLNQIGRDWPEREALRLRLIAIVDAADEARVLRDTVKDDSFFELHVKVLGSEQLEDCFPLEWVNEFFRLKGYSQTWDGKDKINAFLQSQGARTGHEKGLVKKELVEFVVGKVQSKDILKEKIPHAYELLENWNVSNQFKASAR